MMKGVGVLSTSKSCAGRMGTYVKLQWAKAQRDSPRAGVGRRDCGAVGNGKVSTCI